MEIKITKKTIIHIGIIIAFGIICFCFGRFTRLKRVSGASEQLESGIILERDTANTILDELGIARPAGQSASDTGYAVLRGIQKLSESNDTARLCIDKIEREVEYTQQNAKIIEQSFNGVSDAINYGWRVAEEQAAAYERIVETLQQFNNNSSEDDK